MTSLLDEIEEEPGNEPEPEPERQPERQGGPTCTWDGCQERATAGRFGRTYCERHAADAKEEQRQRKNERRRTGGQAGRPRTTGSLKQQIKDSVLMTAAVVAIREPNIYVAVEATVDEFATAWDNVAKQSPTARRYIEGMLTGGVWISAVGATLVMVVTTLAVTDRLPPNLAPLGHFCIGKAGLEVSQVPPGANGSGPPQPGPPQPGDLI